MATLMMKREYNGSWFERSMEAWRHVINVSERTLIDNVAATVPWLAPVSPAYMVWHNAVNLLGWPAWVAWMVALAVEGLGLSVVSTAFSLWKQKSSSFYVAVITTAFYLTLIITVNVALELGASAWIAKALLSLLSIPAAVTIALRSQNAQDLESQQAAAAQAYELKRLELEQAERMKIEAEEREYRRQTDAEERARRHELRLLKEQGKVSESFGNNLPVFASYGKKYSDWRQVPANERERIHNMNTRQVMEAFGVSERTATNWRQNAANERIA